MKQRFKKSLAFLIAFVFAFTGAFMFNGTGTFVYGDVSSVTDDQDTTYPKGGGVLGAIGIDTSVMPETYDPNHTDNPYGSDVVTLSEMNELVKINTTDSSGTQSNLYGHNCKLDGSYDTMMDSTVHSTGVSGPASNAFIAATKCDVNGSGRASGVAMVYTNYRHSSDSAHDNTSGTIYMKIYDPTTRENVSADFTLSDSVEAFLENDVEWNYEAQSQMQIAAGDFDNDTVDEIAVYVPASQGGSARVAIYDLTNGTNCADPYAEAAWQNSWNYVLPKTSANIVECTPPAGHPGTDRYFIPNFYNNVNLAAADADNDGSCDLVISYGASDVNDNGLSKQSILRSLPSRSVILYGSNGDESHGIQMLRDSQELSYGDDALIRVSFGFGDLDGDGNEEMIMGGQMQSEQSENLSRVLAKFSYDEDLGGMISEGAQKIDVVSGQWTEKEDDQSDEKVKTFSSSNGWDGYYHSMPTMTTNIAVGKIFGQQSETRIYMDSVLYSYDTTFSIVDEMEDPSLEDPTDSNSKTKGSAVFTDLKGLDSHSSEQVDYYEYGASVANYTASEADYLTVQRVSQPRTGGSSTKKFIADAAVLVTEQNKDNDEQIDLTAKHDTHEFATVTESGPVSIFAADTDKDSAVAQYTGQHEIQYQDPKVLAVITSAPYFKDVADYDGGDMLSGCSTTYGESSTTGEGYSQNVEIHAGIYTSNTIDFGAKTVWVTDLVGININADTGFQYTRDKEQSVDKSFEVTYGTTAGEDQVVLFSTPVECYTYNVTTGAVDDEGNVTIERFTQTNPDPHKPVTQVIPLDKYKVIQKENKDYLPDVTKYVKSKPGDPSTYPKDSADLPDAVAKSWENVRKEDFITYRGDYRDPYNTERFDAINLAMLTDPFDFSDEEMMTKDDYTWYKQDEWEGAGFGNGFITQTLSADQENSDRKGYGGYFDLEVGLHFKLEAGQGFVTDYDGAHGLQFSVSGDKGMTYTNGRGVSCSGTVANMPRSAEGYGYDFSWSLLQYSVHDTNACIFPVVTYMVTDVKSPPKLPDSITQNYEQTTDSQVCLEWTYTEEEPQEFEIYRYKDFPLGGGDELVGTVAGSDYTTRKDADGEPVKDSDGKVIKEYSFIEDGLTADTKYNYRLKVKRVIQPNESIFSPIIEARTDVSEKPALSLTSDKLTIYPDGQYDLTVQLADPDHYETSMDYQWQKYSKDTYAWEDLDGCNKKTLRFSNCKTDDVGQYRCQVNLVRKHESSPQYISAFTEACNVTYSKRDVTFDPITVFEGTGLAPTNTGVSVGVRNASSTGTSKPTGDVLIRLKGPNGTLKMTLPIDEQTGIARIDSIEQEMGSVAQQSFVNGGYVVTAEYNGDGVFKKKLDEEQYHYLRNIEAVDFLAMESIYYFGQDVIPTTVLERYSLDDSGAIHKEDITDQMTKLVFYTATSEGDKGDKVDENVLSETDGTAKIPLNEKLKKRVYVEAYVNDETDPVACQVVRTAPRPERLYLKGKATGTGELLKLYSFDDMLVVGDCDLSEANMVAESGGDPKSLENLLIFKYYQDNGLYMFDSTEANDKKDQFIPARYKVDLAPKDQDSKKLYETFYSFNNPPKADYLVVGSYYEVTAAPADEGTGSVIMLSPKSVENVDKIGLPGGTKITLKALPAPGFRVKKWVIEDGQGGTQTQNGGDLLQYTLRSENTSGADGEVSITAIFEPKDQTLTYSTKGEGEISVNPYFASGSTVIDGTRLQFTARASEGWHFKEWRWENFGGDNSISSGSTGEDGINSKTYTMGDMPAAVYAIFFRDTINLDMSDNLTAAYVNNGANPLEEVGSEIAVNNGKEVPKGTTVRVRTKPGFEPAEGAEWVVNVTTPDGTSQVDVEDISGSTAGCEFDLPDDVTGCSVELETEKGYYSVELEGENVSYVVSLDGKEIKAEQLEQKLQRIEAGTIVEVQAVPARGYLFDGWMIDGVKDKNAEQTYSFALTDSVTLQAEVKDDVKHTVKLKSNGNGKGCYSITCHDGEVLTGGFGADEISVDVYEGEKLSIYDDPKDTSYILTTVRMDGERQDLVDGVFTLNSVTADAEFVCTFQPTTYCTVSFDVEVDGTNPRFLDGDGNELDISEPIDVGSGENLSFSVIMDSNYPCNVSNEGTPLTPVSTSVSGDSTQYDYSFKVEKSTTLTVDNNTYYEIGTWDEFEAFMNGLSGAGNKKGVKAVLTDDISMPDGASMPQFNGEFFGTLDGKGHTISGLKLGTGSPHQGLSSLFNIIAKEGAVKNLIIDGWDAYVDEYMEDPHSDTAFGNALLARINKGTISGVTLKNCSLAQKIQGEPRTEAPELAGIAAYNVGTIEACQVINLKLNADRELGQMGNQTGSALILKNHIGREGEIITQGTLNGCYVEGLQIYLDGHYATPDSSIISDDYAGHGTFKGNYYRGGSDENGTNVTSITDNPDDVKFAANLAYHMNDEAGILWGIYKNNEPAGDGDTVTPQIVPLAYAGEDCKAPVRALLKHGEDKKGAYFYPGPSELPGGDIFEGATITFWKVGSEGKVAYSPHYKYVDIEEDMTFVGVETFDECVATLTSKDPTDPDKTRTIAFADVKDALNTAKAEAANMDDIQIDVVGDCSLASGTYTIPANAVMTVTDGKTLTITKNANIINKGTFTCAEGSTVEKRGTMNNTGTINVNGTFWNYGSKLINKGDIVNQKDIKCKPHLLGEWECSDEPDEHGNWINSAICEVCTNPQEEVIPADPDADDIDYIEVYRYPAKADYLIGDEFSDDGLLVSAVTKDGFRAKIDSYQMTISDGSSEPVPIHNGDVLDSHGAMDITVSYEGFECDFGIVVRSAAVGISIADGDREVASGEELQLEAVVEWNEGQEQPIAVQWTSEDESIATVDENGVVTGKSAGQVMITASIDDLTASCIVTVHDAATSLELDKNLLVPLDGNELLAAKVLPASADGEVTWTVKDPSVAGIRVTDEETGETSVVDTATTQLTPGKGSESVSYITVAGVGTGTTVVTASVKDARGLTIHKDCSVEVREAEAWVHMMYNGSVVSGSTITADASQGTLTFTTESSEEEDTLLWTVIDDGGDPVISVDNDGNVKLLRSGVAAVRVVSEVTNVSDVCLLKVVRMPTSIDLSLSSIHMAKGYGKMVTATINPENADGTIEWTSSNEKVALVSNAGYITGEAPGTATVTARSTADGSVKAQCKVTVYDPEIKIILSKDTFYYDGKKKVPAVTVKSGNTVLAKKITKSNSRVLLIFEGGLRAPGKMTVTAVGRDEGMGSASATYKIIVKPTKLKKVKGKKKAIKVKWATKKKGYVTGYQVQVATNKAFTKNVKKKTVKKYDINKVTIKKLKGKKKYYVRVRTYKRIGGTNYYSAWSKVKTVKTKK